MKDILETGHITQKDIVEWGDEEDEN